MADCQQKLDFLIEWVFILMMFCLQFQFLLLQV